MKDLMSAREIGPLFGLQIMRSNAFKRFGIPIAEEIAYGKTDKKGVLRFALRSDVEAALKRELALREARTQKLALRAEQPDPEPQASAASTQSELRQLEESIALLHRKVDRLLADLGIPEIGES